MLQQFHPKHIKANKVYLMLKLCKAPPPPLSVQENNHSCGCQSQSWSSPPLPPFFCWSWEKLSEVTHADNRRTRQQREITLRALDGNKYTL